MHSHHVRFVHIGTQMVNTILNIQTRGLRTPQKGANAHYSVMGWGST
jgi:hypothetical protein